MLNRFKNEDEGFTLIELLVVILIIGILAAIALPSFLGQQKKGQDTSAKSNARNAVSYVKSCYADEQDYTQCEDEAVVFEDSGIPTAGDEAVAVVANGAKAFTVTAQSKSDPNAEFSIAVDDAAGTQVRQCTEDGKGGCKGDGNW